MAGLDLVELGARQGGALGGFFLIEVGQLAGTVEVVGEAGMGLEGEGRLGTRSRRHWEPFEAGISAGSAGISS